MKTAIIKTDYWKEDKIFELLPDARYFYLCLLTNPERTTTAAFKCSDRLMSAYTGYNQDVIKLCQKELISKKLIQIVDGYYILNEQDFVQANKGKLSTQLYEKDFNLLPLKVKELLHSRSGVAQEYKDKDNNKDKNIDISNKNEIVKLDENATHIAQVMELGIIENFSFLKNKEIDVNKWTTDIEKIHRLDGYEWNIIEATLKWALNDDFWKQNIRSGSKFRKQFNRLLISAKSEHDNQTKHGVTII